MQKSICMALLLVSLLGFSGCHFSMYDGYMFDYSGVQLEQKLTGEIPEGVKELSIENKFGDVVVTRTNSSESSWEWTGNVWADDDEMAELFSAELEMTESIDNGAYSLVLVLPEPEKALNGIRSDLELRIPEGISVKSTNAHGNTQVDGVTDGVNATNRHGDLLLANLGPNLVAENAHGNVSVKNIYDADIKNSHGNVTLANAMGNALVKNSHGRVNTTNTNQLTVQASHTNITVQNGIGDMDLKTTHGRIEVEAVQGNLAVDNRHGNIVVDGLDGQIVAETSHANINVNGRASLVKLDNSHGNINVDLVNDSFTKIDLDTSHGNLTLDLPASALVNVKMDGKGTSGFENHPDGAPVRLDTSHGRISVNAKE